MSDINDKNFIIGPDDRILVTGASGFIGTKLVAYLRERGFRNVRCFIRSSRGAAKLQNLLHNDRARLEVMKGNLLLPEDCAEATRDVAVVFHLAAGRGEKSFPDAFANSVITTRNLLDACRQRNCLRRFVNVSSFAVYSNREKSQRNVLDESCPLEENPQGRGEAYTFAKVKQDEIVRGYGERFGIPYVIVRPGCVYGPGNEAIPGRVGIDTFGPFLHLGGSNPIPLTYVDNCAEAIALAGLVPDVDGEIFNIVDDDLPSSRQFLRLYRQNVRNMRSIYVPHVISYMLCYLWERYSEVSNEQLPPVFNRRRWHANWKKTSYSNAKTKLRLAWSPSISTACALDRYFESCRSRGRDA